MYYLAADGFKIKTPLFTLRIRLPGECDGSETRLGGDIAPEPRFQPTAQFRNYLKDKVKVVIDGVDLTEGRIVEALDESAGVADEVMTLGSIMTIRGYGLKVEADEDKKEWAGVFFRPDEGEAVKAPVLAVNEPRTLKVLVPTNLSPGMAYRILVRTQSAARGHGTLLKTAREVVSDFTLTPREQS